MAMTTTVRFVVSLLFVTVVGTMAQDQSPADQFYAVATGWASAALATVQ